MKYGIDKFNNLWIADDNWNKVAECNAFTKRSGEYTREAKSLMKQHGLDHTDSSDMHTEDTMEQAKEFDDMKNRFFAKSAARKARGL